MNVMTAMSAPATVPVQPGPARFTTAEFWRMVEAGAFDDIKVELIHGELQRMPPPRNAHSLLQVTLITDLVALLTRSVVRVEIGIDLGDNSIVGADVAVLKAAITEDRLVAAAEVLLTVEIAVSTADRDLGLKRRLYAAAGIPTYWVVDVERAVVHVFDRPEGGEYLGLALVRYGEPLPVPGTDATIILG